MCVCVCVCARVCVVTCEMDGAASKSDSAQLSAAEPQRRTGGSADCRPQLIMATRSHAHSKRHVTRRTCSSPRRCHSDTSLADVKL